MELPNDMRSRDFAIARTALEDVQMRANKAIFRK
jgi:hypothetical protein